MLHASLLLIFAGSVVTYFFKTEGSLCLWEGENGNQIIQRGPDNRVVATHDLPFAVMLLDFVLETYPGTMRPSGFSSIVKLQRSRHRHAVRRQDLDEQPARRTAATPSSSRATSRTAAGRRRCSRCRRTRARTSSSSATSPWSSGMIIVLFTRVGQARERAALEARDAGSGGAKVARRGPPGPPRRHRPGRGHGRRAPPAAGAARRSDHAARHPGARGGLEGHRGLSLAR